MDDQQAATQETASAGREFDAERWLQLIDARAREFHGRTGHASGKSRAPRDRTKEILKRGKKK